MNQRQQTTSGRTTAVASSTQCGVEIPFKDGKLGRVKEIRIVYQSR